MKTQDIKNMGQAYFQVLEAMKKKKMDPVDADELKGSHADRSDKDIDNDGDADKSDEYLHNRRKAIKATITKEEVEEMDEAKKMSISAKAIKNALASAKAQAKPKDQVSLKKAPFDIPKESVVQLKETGLF
jgi:ribosomal protein L28